jgi:hypothetical protein
MTTQSADLVEGRIYVIRSSLPVEKQIASAEENGAIAVVVITPTYLVSGYLAYRMNDRLLARSISIPVFEVPLQDGKILWSLANNDQILNATIMPDRIENPWTVVLESGGIIFNAVVLCAFSLTNIGLGIWKIITFVKYFGGFRTSIALYVLAIEIFSNLIRFVASIEQHGAFELYPEWAIVMLMEFSFPFALAAYLLFTLYWHEMMTNATVIVHPFITRMRIPFFIVSALLVSLQVIRTVIRSVTTLEFNFNIVTAAIYIAVLVGLMVFYAVTGGKVLKRLQSSKKMGRTVQLRRTTRRILIGGGFLLFWIIVAILFVSGVAYQPIGIPIVFAVLFVILDVASLMNILAFEVPEAHSSRSGSTASMKRHSVNHSTASDTATTGPTSLV